MDYEAKCKWAATNQGLDPLMEELRAAGTEFALEQTGGFCMAVTTRVEGGTWAAVYDVDDWLVGFYPANSWHDGGQGAMHESTPPDAATAARVMASPPEGPGA